jgi:hypothetical protein
LDNYSLFISGKIFVHFDEQKRLDKIVDVWYNGKTRRIDQGRRAENRAYKIHL